MIATEQVIDAVAQEMLQWPVSRRWNSKDKDSRIRSFFGAPLHLIAEIWNRIWTKLSEEEKNGLIEDNVHYRYLLYALLMMKVYAPVEVLCSMVGWPSTKTFRKWSWYFTKKIAGLKSDVIKLRNRFGGYRPGDTVRTNVFTSVDGVDCPINEPWPFDPAWFSHKINGPALKYEVAVCIKTGFIVWINGPFKASIGDSTIFREGLSHQLAVDEKVEADSGYNIKDECRAQRQLVMPGAGVTTHDRKAKSIARSRNERVNGRLKQFNVLASFFRHSKPRELMTEKHKFCFYSIAVITQLKMEQGEAITDYQEGEYDVSYF